MFNGWGDAIWGVNIHDPCIKGDTATVARLLEQGKVRDIDSVGMLGGVMCGNTPLYEARSLSTSNSISYIRLLLNTPDLLIFLKSLIFLL